MFCMLDLGIGLPEKDTFQAKEYAILHSDCSTNTEDVRFVANVMSFPGVNDFHDTMVDFSFGSVTKNAHVRRCLQLVALKDVLTYCVGPDAAILVMSHLDPKPQVTGVLSELKDVEKAAASREEAIKSCHRESVRRLREILSTPVYKW